MKNIFSMNDNELNYVFDKYIKNGYFNFNFLYDWSKYNFVEMYLKRLMLKSIAVNNDDDLFLKNVSTYINDVEEFFATGLYADIFTDDNIANVVDVFSDKVQFIRHLPIEYRGCYGRNVKDGIEINQHFSVHPNSGVLNKDEIRQLYLFHELGHNILNLTDDVKIIDFCDSFMDVLSSKSDYYPMYNISKEMVYSGFWLLEEALSQELGEFLVYEKANKMRPEKREEIDLGIKFYTNFDYYGLFQDIAINFGNTIRGVGEYKDDPNMLVDMIKKTINSDFVFELITEYNDGDATLYHDLGMILQSMGNILNEKYESFSERPFECTGVSPVRSYKTIKNLCNRNCDFREIKKY